MKKIALISLVLVLAMGTLGVGYALWSDTLYIEGEVNTGEVDVGFYCDWGVCSDSEPAEKDVSSISKQIISPTLLQITITNAYPSIDYYAQFCIVTQGTIPVHFGNWIINRGTMPADATILVTPNLYGVQKEPNMHTECSLHVHLGNDATMLATYTFTIEITAGQWNEYP